MLKNIQLFFIWLAILMAFPFSISNAYELPAKPIISICTVILLGFSLLYIFKSRLNKVVIIMLLVQIFTAITFIIIHMDSAYVNFSLQLIIVLIIFILLENGLYIQFCKQLLGFVSVMAVFSVIIFFLCLVFNVAPLNEFTNPDGRPGYNFIITFTNVYFDVGAFKIIRPSGFFDEPGTLSFYLIIGTLLNDLLFQYKRIRIVLLVCGIFTLSLAFYALLILYLCFRYKKRYLSKIVLATFIVVLISTFAISSLDEEKQTLLYGYTFGRIENIFDDKSKSDDTYFQGDNRSDLIENSFFAIRDSPIIGQGLSYRTNTSSVIYGKFVGANPLSLFAIHGLFGGVIFSLHLFYYLWVCFKTRRFNLEIKSAIILALLILQRPDYVGGILPYINILILLYATKQHKLSNTPVYNYNSGI
ncbi:O-antigen ligase family protein [Pedobacter alpinus]|uniref:O-antigen ligase family protein n=1 Tax=Pedobacter alpinus TaxID=1590643 RepID=A0ABW5TQH7_9SPHI